MQNKTNFEIGHLVLSIFKKKQEKKNTRCPYRRKDILRRITSCKLKTWAMKTSDRVEISPQKLSKISARVRTGVNTSHKSSEHECMNTNGTRENTSELNYRNLCEFELKHYLEKKTALAYLAYNFSHRFAWPTCRLLRAIEISIFGNGYWVYVM